MLLYHFVDPCADHLQRILLQDDPSQRIFTGILFRGSLCKSSVESSSEDLHGDSLRRIIVLISSEDLRWNPLQMIFVRILFRGFFYRMIILRGSSWGSSSEDPCADHVQRILLQDDLLQRILVRILFRGSSSLMSWKGCWCCIICPPTHPHTQ